jgi:NAD(P)-dependent dehydrogenase (short-subunit alcohol dehydrogenase family)
MIIHRGEEFVVADLTVSSKAAEGGLDQDMGRVVVITGGSAGVGRACVGAFAGHGFDVAVLARGGAGLEGAAKDAENAGVRALALPVDVADATQVRQAASEIESQFGEIDVWVNNAMTTVFAPVSEIDPADFQRAIEVTFLGQVWGTMAALEHMRPRDRGTIVEVGSALAFIGIPLQAAYCSAKFACRGFFESTRSELLHQGSHVRMSMVHLPALNTPQFDWCASAVDRHPMPVPPIYQPELAAAAILEAALDGRRESVLGSWNRLLVTAAKFVPGLGNQFAARGAWDTQLTTEPISPDRPVNLRRPVDAEADHGAHGSFGDQAGGFMDPHFLKGLPRTARTFGAATAATIRERKQVRDRRRSA